MSRQDWVWIPPNSLHGGRRLCLAPFGKSASEALPFITRDDGKLDVSASSARLAAFFCGLMPISELSIYSDQHDQASLVGTFKVDEDGYADVSELPAHMGEHFDSPLWISYKIGLGQIAMDGIYILLGMGHMLMDRSRDLLGIKQEA